MIQDLQMLIGQLIVFSLMRYFDMLKTWRGAVLGAIWTTVFAGLMRRYIW